MAIIQSILVGKGKGKIGNVVLSGLKGQTVAKQLNSSPSNPRTVAQTANRVKMANAVLAWQYLALFFASAKGLRKPLESVYNAFIRTVVSDMKTVLEVSRGNAAYTALMLQGFAGNWFPITSFLPSVNGGVVNFSAPGVQWADTFRVRVILSDTVTDKQVVHDVPILANDFATGKVTVVKDAFAAADVSAVYIYDSASSKITNILCAEL